MRKLVQSIITISVISLSGYGTAHACHYGQASSITRSCEAGVAVYRGSIGRPDYAPYIAAQNRIEAQAQARRAEAKADRARAQADKAQAITLSQRPNIIINNDGYRNRRYYGSSVGSGFGFRTRGFRSTTSNRSRFNRGLRFRGQGFNIRNQRFASNRFISKNTSISSTTPSAKAPRKGGSFIGNSGRKFKGGSIKARKSGTRYSGHSHK